MTETPAGAEAPTDLTALTEGVQASAPFIRTLGIEVLDVSDDHVLLRIPDRVEVHNHVGGPHAGAIFSLGETAAATLLVRRFGDWLATHVPLAVGGTIRWTKLARSAVTADARMQRPAEDVVAELAAGQRPEWDTAVTFRRAEDNEVCAEMVVTLTLAVRRPAEVTGE